jgi:hypothetical protein
VSFASKFSGVVDSTILFYERYRRLDAFQERSVMARKTDCMKLNERIRITNMDLRSNKEGQPMTAKMSLYFGKNLGLVEWHDQKQTQHFVLESVLTQEEWIKLMSR